MQNQEKTEMEIEAPEAAQSPTQMLYEASMRGCVATLKTLIQNHPSILHNIPPTPSTETLTPLHISALLGHVEFTEAIVSQKPQLVTGLDSFKRSPLHFAAAEGHREIVKELLKTNKEVSMFADQEGRIPLHLAAMRGRVEVIQELLRAKPESIREHIRGETALHLCVKHNHLDALKVLVASVDDEEFLNSKNHEGNSILQVSAMLQKYETTSYLLSVPKIRGDLNSLIKKGFPAFDGSCRNGTTQSNLQKSPIQKLKSIITSFFKLSQCKVDRYEKTRGNLMVVAGLIATMSFQIITNPPGGYWQEEMKGEACPKGKFCGAGTPVHLYSRSYGSLIILSTLSFVSSLSVILSLISGVRFRNGVSVGILVAQLWVSVLCIASAYILSMSMVIPDYEIFYYFNDWYVFLMRLLVFPIVLLQVIIFCWWVLKKLVKGVNFVAKCFKEKKQFDQPVESV